MRTEIVFLLLVLTFSAPGPAPAQNQALPQDWESLSVADFAKAVEKQRTQGPLSPELTDAIAKHAVERLFKTDQTLDELTYADIGTLFRYARPQLTPGQIDVIRQRALARADGQMEFRAMRSKVALMTLTSAKNVQKEAQVANWVGGGNLEAQQPDLSPADASWLYQMLSRPFLKNGSFSVVWTANLQAPRTGTYVFSLPPINVNSSQWKNLSVQVDWRVVVDGKEVLRAKPDRWTTESSAVELTADQPVKFRAEANFKVSRPMQNEIFAILYWRGPGITTSVVPAESWTTPDGSSRGLVAEYRAELQGTKGPQTVSRVDPTIDFNWALDHVLVPRYAKEQQRAVKYFQGKFMSPEYLDRSASGKAAHPFLVRPLAMAECLNSAQRREFLKEVLQRPTMLSPLDRNQATALFGAYRLGAANEALEAFGTWCMTHADLASELPKRGTGEDFFATNRLAFVHLAHRLSRENPALLKTLEDKYAQTEDGRCSLPAAYTLAYAYRVQNKIDVWIQLLEIKLAEPNLRGGQRVNWLVARAMAEEIRHASAERDSVAAEDLSPGLNWLKVAEEAAQTDEQRLQVLKEFAARDVARNHFDVAKTRLDAATNATQPGPSQEAMKRLGAEADRIAAKIKKRGEADAAAARVAYRNEIARRQQVASEKGDASEAERLGQLLDEAK